MESSPFKPYTAPRIEVVEVVLESTVLQPSANSRTRNLEEYDFIW